MRLPPYPKYRPSGVEWLGEVPEHWVVQRLRYVCRFAYGDALASEEREDGEVPVFGSNGPVGTHRSANTKRPVVVIGRKGSHGKVNYSASEAFAIDTTYFIDNRLTRSDLRWLFYTLGALGLDAVSKDSAVPGLAREDAYAHATAVPSIDEQRAIADFLDRETAKIDTLVAKKRTLIERLKEKRTALISRTVTRGLPPDAARAVGLDPHPKLKPSGIDWLGDVPEHWEVKPLGRLVRFVGGATPDKGKPEYWDGDIPWVSPKDMKRMRIADVPDHISREALSSSPLTLLPVKSVLIVVRGMILAHSFPVAITDVPVTINQDMKAIAAGRQLNADYLLWSLTGISRVFVSLADESAHGTRKLESEIVSRVCLTLPSLMEQQAIAKFLSRETARIDRMVAKVETAIDRLQEYRTALITAAVTGKIDVRGAAA